jgi:hypothetical protein
MDEALKFYVGLLLESHLPKEVSFIIETYLRPLKYFVLGVYDATINRDVEISHVFRAYCIQDIIKYILYDYSEKETLFYTSFCEVELPSLRQKMKSSLSKEEWKEYKSQPERYFNNHPQLTLDLIKWAQELYGDNPELFLLDLKQTQVNESVTCLILMEMTPFFSCINRFIMGTPNYSINIYNGQKGNFDIKNCYLYGTPYQKNEKVMKNNRRENRDTEEIELMIQTMEEEEELELQAQEEEELELQAQEEEELELQAQEEEELELQAQEEEELELQAQEEEELELQAQEEEELELQAQEEEELELQAQEEEELELQAQEEEEY